MNQTANSITPETDYLPAKPEELSYDLAYRAYSNISFNAERRAKEDQDNFADDVNSFYSALANEFTNEDQITYLDTAIQEYKTTFLSKYGAYLSSLSRVASVMIAGPSNFATARNQKRSNTADSRMAEFSEWRVNAENSIRQHLLSLRTTDQKIDAEWVKIKFEINRSLGVIHDIDQGKSFWNRASFVNSINGMVQTLAKNGRVEMVERALALVTKYNETFEKPAITPKHKFWQLLDLAKKVKGAL